MNQLFKEKLEQDIITTFRSVIDEMSSIWEKLGILEETQCERSKVAKDIIIAQMVEVAESEANLYKDFVEKVNKYTKQLEELAEELSLVPGCVDESMPLIEREKQLREQVDKMTFERHSRIRKLQQLKKVENKFCTMLNMPLYEVTSCTGVPNETDLVELEAHVTMLQDERDRRHRKFCLAKRELTTIIETTELAPETELEREVLYHDEECLLSNEKLRELEESVAKFNTKKSELEREKQNLVENLLKLWDRLNICPTKRETFLAKHNDLRLSTLQKLQQEIDRCLEVKKQNLKSYIATVQNELQELWKICHVPDSEQKRFLAQFEDVSDEVLNIFETEVEQMKIYYKTTADILKKIEKREELWSQMLVFESKAKDPNRFVNRGGNLLQEERERKKLQKELPKLECDIFAAIDKFEENCGKQFMYNGTNFQEFVKNQWEQRQNEKENEKILKQKQRNLMVAHEVTMGTPISKRPLMTPKSAPSKMFKLNSGLSIFRTPVANSKLMTPNTCSVSRRQPKTTPNKSPRYALRNSLRRNVLTENNTKKPADSANETSYSDFAEELDKPTRSNFRSSVLHPRKVLSGKVNSIRKRKSAGTSSKSRNSRTQPVLMDKLTPVRGKLGLPFLI